MQKSCPILRPSQARPTELRWKSERLPTDGNSIGKTSDLWSPQVRKRRSCQTLASFPSQRNQIWLGQKGHAPSRVQATIKGLSLKRALFQMLSVAPSTLGIMVRFCPMTGDVLLTLSSIQTTTVLRVMWLFPVARCNDYITLGLGSHHRCNCWTSKPK